MVFESLLVEVLNRFLGPYVKNLDGSQLKVGIFGGDVRLSNLMLKENALEDVGVPARIFGGHLDELHLKIPWRNLYGAPVVAEVVGLYVVAGPASAALYDEATAAKEQKDAKDRQLKKIEQAKLKSKTLVKSDPGFVEKLITQIIKNVQITIKNIHILYEDKVTNPSSPFQCGVTLDSLYVQSTDEGFKMGSSVAPDVTSLIYKLVELNCLSLYWHSNTDLLGPNLPDDWKSILLEHIYRPDSKSSKNKFVLSPVTAKATLQLSMSPGEDLDVPQALANLLLDHISITLAKQQYQDLMKWVESVDRKLINKKFLKYRPRVGVVEDKGAWWRYAITATLEEDVKRRSRMWAWSHIKKHRDKCRKYTELYTKKLISSSSTASLLTELDELETHLDVFNITVCRQLAENQAESHREGERELAKKKSQQSWSSWVGGWVYGGKEKEEELAEVSKDISEEEMLQQRQKMFEALGYSESVAAAAYPIEYVSQRLKVNLKKVSINLVNDTGSHHRSVATVTTNNVDLEVRFRSSAGALGVAVGVESFEMKGLGKSNGPPDIITSQKDETGPLLSVNFDLKPLGSQADQRIGVDLQAIRIVYDAATIDAIIDMFLLPKDVVLQNLSAGAASTLNDLRTQSRAGLEYIVGHRKLLDVAISVKSPYLVVPQSGCMNSCEHVLVADLGSLSVTSNIQQIDARVATLEALEDAAYDHFNLRLSGMKLLVAGSQQDWNAARATSRSPFHILTPLELNLELHKSISPKDTKMPNIKLNGSLPELSLSLSDYKMGLVMQVVHSLPLPPPSLARRNEQQLNITYESLAPVELDPTEYLHQLGGPAPAKEEDVSDSDSDQFYDADEGEFDQSLGTYINKSWSDSLLADNRVEKTSSVSSSRPSSVVVVSKDDQLKSSTDLVLDFKIYKAGIQFDMRSPTATDDPLLNFVLRDMSTHVELMTWQMLVTASLGSLAVMDHCGRDNEINLMVAAGQVGGRGLDEVDQEDEEETKKFMEAVFKKNSSSSPQFASLYDSTHQSLEVDVSTVRLNLVSDSLTKLMAVAKDISRTINNLRKETTEGEEKDVHSDRSLQTVSSQSSGQDVNSPESSSSRMPEEGVSGKQLHLRVGLGGVELTLSDCQVGDLLATHIKGLSAIVEMYGDKTEVDTRVHKLSLRNLDSGSCHSNVVATTNEDKNIICAKVVLFKTKPRHDDLEGADMSVEAEVQRVQVTVTFKFLNRIQNFAMRFVEHLKLDEQMVESARMVASNAVEKTADVIKESSSSRLKLVLLVQAPVLVVPLTSSSSSAFILDFGTIKARNKFLFTRTLAEAGPKEDGFATDDNCEAIVDQMEVSLESVLLGRVEDVKGDYKKVWERVGVIGRTPLFRCSLNRNLSSWCTKVPSVDVSTSLDAIEVYFSSEDYKSVMTILNSVKERKLEELKEGEEKAKEMKAVKQSSRDDEEKVLSKGKEAEESSDENGGTGWVRVLAKIDLVHVFLHSQKLGKVMTLNLKGLCTNVVIVPSKTLVTACITGVEVTDPSQTTRHPQACGDTYRIFIVRTEQLILSVIDDQQALTTEVEILSKPPDPLDVQGYDMSISASMSRLRVTFVYLFIGRLLRFIKMVGVDTEEAKESARQGASAAVTAVQEQEKNGKRVRLSISIDAPVVLVPVRSDSLHLLVAHLGSMSLVNSFRLLTVEGKEGVSKKSALLDDILVELSNMTIHRQAAVDSDCSLSETGTSAVPLDCPNSSMIMAPFGFTMAITRNLSSWHHTLPQTDIRADIGSLKMMARGDDIDCVCQILSGNVREDEGEEPAGVKEIGIVPAPMKASSNVVEKSQGEELEPAMKEEEEQSAEPREDWVSLLVTAKLESIDLAVSESKKSRTSSSDDGSGLASLVLSHFQASLEQRTNGTLDVSASVADLALDDARPQAIAGATRLVQKCLMVSNEETEEEQEKLLNLPLVSFKFTQSQWDESVVHLDVNGPQVVFNTHAIMALLDFFKTSTKALSSDRHSPSEINVIEEEFHSRTSNARFQLGNELESVDTGLDKKGMNKKESGNVLVKGVVRKPVVALLEHSKSHDPRALVLQGEVMVDMLMGQNRSVILNVTDLELTSTRTSQLRNSHNKVFETKLKPLRLSVTTFGHSTVVDVAIPSLYVVISPNTVRLVLSVVEAFSSATHKVVSTIITDTCPQDLWVEKLIDRSVWYMNASPPTLEIPSPSEQSQLDILSSQQLVTDENMNLVVESISITMEKELAGGVSVPVVLISMGSQDRKALSMELKNWSSEMYATAELSLMVTYNALARGTWEPILEPITDPKDDQAPQSMWSLKFDIQKWMTTSSPFLTRKAERISSQKLVIISPSPSALSFKRHSSSKLLHNRSQHFGFSGSSKHKDLSQSSPLQHRNLVPEMQIQITADNPLQLTLTKSSLGLVKGLLDDYLAEEKQKAVKVEDSLEETDSFEPEMFEPIYTVVNKLGKRYSIKIEGSNNIKVHRAASSVLHHDSQLDLFPGGDMMVMKPGDFLPKQSSIHRLHKITINLPGYEPLPVFLGSRECFYYPLIPAQTLKTPSPHSGSKSFGLVVEIVRKSEFNCPQVILRSTLKVVNSLEEDLELCVVHSSQERPDKPNIPRLKGGDTAYIPMEYETMSDFAIFIRPAIQKKAGWSSSPVVWHSMDKKTNLEVRLGSGQLKNIAAVSMHENLNKSALRSEGRKSVTNYLLLAYPVCVQNKLPMTLKVQDKHSKEVSHRQSSSIPSGDVFNFATIPVGSTVYLKAQLNYRDLEWVGTVHIDPDDPYVNTFDLKPHHDPGVVKDACSTKSLLMKSSITLSVSLETKGTLILSVYSPYWMVNKTGEMLQYCESKDGPVTTHPPDAVIALFPSKMARVRVLTSNAVTEWSNPFSLDAAGTNGIFSTKDKNLDFQMGMNVRMSSAGLSKVITIAPQFMVSNKTKDNITVYVKEMGHSQRFTVPSCQLISLWAPGEAEWMMASMVFNGKPCNSQYFKMKDNASMLLRMGSVGCLVVEVVVTGSGNIVTFLPYYEGAMPFHIVNDTDYNLEFYQNAEVKGTHHVVQPGSSQLYTWDYPNHTEALKWGLQKAKKTKAMTEIISRGGSGQFDIIPLKKAKSRVELLANQHTGGENFDEPDGGGVYSGDEVDWTSGEESGSGVSSDEDWCGDGQDEVDGGVGSSPKVRPKQRSLYKRMKSLVSASNLMVKMPSKRKIKRRQLGYWIVFRDGEQRMLLFTTNRKLRDVIVRGNYEERPQYNVSVSLQSIGISLVNDTLGLEVAYIGITHSHPVWEESKRFGHYKAVPNWQREVLENLYKTALNSRQEEDLLVNIPDTHLQVDFTDLENIQILDLNKKEKPKKLRRSRYEGILVEVSVSSHRTCIYASINAIQVDNHLPYSANPTILFPYPVPPKVASKHAPHPFIEASMIMRKNDQLSVSDMELIQVLVQALGVNVDLTFIMATVDIFSDWPTTKTQRDLIEEDIAMAKESLENSEVAKVNSSAASRTYFKLLHLSPLEIHLSFSLEKDKEFEITTEYESHGNPVVIALLNSLKQFGIIIGKTKGAELKLGYFELEEETLTDTALYSKISMHYIQQAALQLYRVVLGLEVLGNPVGLVKGLKDGAVGLFYHPIQGAVLGPDEFFEGLTLGSRQFFEGTVGGVTGALGKMTGAWGDAAAKLSFNTEFQQERKKVTGTFGEGVEGAAKGVFHGITGVIVQPVKGAIDEGFLGLIKGTGKGLVGLLARPAVGIFDFASATFNTVQKKTRVGEYEVTQIRPARWIGPDKIVYPYSPNKAIGNAVFLKYDNGRLRDTDYFFGYVELVENPVKAILITSEHFAFIKYSETHISAKYDHEFIFHFNELVGPNPLSSNGNVVQWYVMESSLFSSSLSRIHLRIGSTKQKKVAKDLKVKTAAHAKKVVTLVNQAYDEFMYTY